MSKYGKKFGIRDILCIDSHTRPARALAAQNSETQREKNNNNKICKKQIERRTLVRCAVYNLYLLNKTHWTTDYYDEIETPYPFCPPKCYMFTWPFFCIIHTHVVKRSGLRNHG